jgi:hypothetical protein
VCGVFSRVEIFVMLTQHIVWQGGHILLQSAPIGVDVEDVKHDLEKVKVLLAYL